MYFCSTLLLNEQHLEHRLSGTLGTVSQGVESSVGHKGVEHPIVQVRLLARAALCEKNSASHTQDILFSGSYLMETCAISVVKSVANPVANTFVRAAEVWIPKQDKLVLASGDYGESQAFAEASVTESFAKGEGLPGKVWESEKPIVLKKFDRSYFKRAEAAAEAGLTSAVAIPVFAENNLKAVLVLFCGSDVGHSGAIELWENTEQYLMLADGYYGSATEFEAASQIISFSYGMGLPGNVWAANTPILKRDIARASNFLRSEQAAAVGFTTGLGLPVPIPGDTVCILTLLSASNTPLARRFEIWDARPECVGATRQAQLIDGLCEREGALWAQQNPPVDPPMAQAWKGPIGQVLGTGLPYVQREGTGLPATYSSMFALPVYHDADLAYVVACYL